MKVYVFTYQIVDNHEDLGIYTRVFANKQDAIKALKDWRDDEITYVEENEWIIEEDTDCLFEAYQDGCYCSNHSFGMITENEVK